MATFTSPLSPPSTANEQVDIAHQPIRPILEKDPASYPAPSATEKEDGVPFTLTLQEDKGNPGQFRLVVNINADNNESDTAAGGNTGNTPPRKLYLNPQALPGLGYDVSSLYRTQKSSPPTSPQERQGWSDLDAIPPDFLKKVVPDWDIPLNRNASTSSKEPKRLSDIKARIKKSGKGFVVRLLKGVNPESNEVAEVHLAHQGVGIPELDSTPQVELDGNAVPIDANQPSQSNAREIPARKTEVFEIGTSSEIGIRRPTGAQPQSIPQIAPQSFSAVPRWLTQTRSVASSRLSIGDDSFSDAETLISDIRRPSSPWEEVDDDATDTEPISSATSRLPTRSASISSVVPTPTRGLSVVGPVKRVKHSERSKNTSSPLNRSHAKKSVKRRSPRNLSWALTTPLQADQFKTDAKPKEFNYQHAFGGQSFDEPPADISTWHHPIQISRRSPKGTIVRHPSLEIPSQNRKEKKRLRLQTTDVPRHHSANASPATLSNRHTPRSAQSERGSVIGREQDRTPRTVSPVHPHVDEAQELRSALERVLKDNYSDDNVVESSGIQLNVQPPEIGDDVGEIALPPDLELRQPSSQSRSPIMTFISLASTALTSKLFEGISFLQDTYGSEPPVPRDHVRVRWTCSCGEQLYDDFIEKRRGAARLLEAFLNRPRTHAPSAPGRSSTSSTMSSVFSSLSTASTLATPQSTYDGSQSWGQGDPSRYSPTMLRSSNPFSVRIASYPDPQWLLTCANEGRYTPKIVHLDVNPARIKSDKDFALALREHYGNLNRKLFRVLKLRGLITIDFVQFEIHRNRFADIRKCPDMPSQKSDYDFEPVDLVPPVGSKYLLHLFKHPEDYDGELITYLRSPKRRARLDFGVGWGINLVEGFLADRVWTLIMTFFIIGSMVFAIVWVIKKDNDVQGAFGVAGWLMTLAALSVGWAQAWLE
ncbi:uncharacterized protein BDZ99DRAFT_483444 [Mytilinidion resinicola]|uniref:Uncharacterized protein n=1 Tax=Mytilinidion resinicola TaxID=574789 RepID=A0A6A6XYM5_9PEZI|nr:uncharacterized protein BDZ99DRAFT_483444 [Mytilinidion resinicola]KAF2801651.1 hypothetical protein BDZ99DRAFT_483444 [Mytilinidion resinicola]